MDAPSDNTGAIIGTLFVILVLSMLAILLGVYLCKKRSSPTTPVDKKTRFLDDWASDDSEESIDTTTQLCSVCGAPARAKGLLRTGQVVYFCKIHALERGARRKSAVAAAAEESHAAASALQSKSGDGYTVLPLNAETVRAAKPRKKNKRNKPPPPGAVEASQDASYQALPVSVRKGQVIYDQGLPKNPVVYDASLPLDEPNDADAADMYMSLPLHAGGVPKEEKKELQYATLQSEDKGSPLTYTELPQEATSRSHKKSRKSSKGSKSSQSSSKKSRKSRNRSTKMEDDVDDVDGTIPHISETVSLAATKAYFQGIKEAGDSTAFDALHKIPRSQVTIMRDHKLGNGEYGVVYEGTWKGLQVAVKELNASAKGDAERRLAFAREVKLMEEIGEHPHVLRAYGACNDENGSYLLLEFAAHGSLESVMADMADDADLDRVTAIRMAYEIASGMAYLHDTAGVIHRDLAARNVLLTEDGHLKIADFGLSRATAGGTMGTGAARKFPIKWLAPETLKEGVFSRATDVWSYGILIWEIFNGVQPYKNMTILEVVQKVTTDTSFHPHIAPSIPAALRSVLKECFDHNPKNRPTMANVEERLKLAMTQDARKSFN